MIFKAIMSGSKVVLTGGLALIGFSATAHAQEAVFGGALQPRIVEGEA